MVSEEEIEEKLEKGWIKSRMWFEVLSLNKELTQNSLKSHIGKLKKSPNTISLKESFVDVKEVPDPTKNADKAYVQSVEIELLTKDTATLLYNVIFFAPSAVEILRPEKLTLGANDVQVIMNSVADLIHKYASQGLGGVVISAK